jgi:ribonuclease P protein component
VFVRKKTTLTGKTQFGLVFEKGRSWATKEVVVKVLPNSLEATRYGLTVSRHVGNAVVRNKVKRRLREILRPLNLPDGWDIVIIARNTAATTDFGTLGRTIKHIFTRAGLMRVENEGNSLRAN